MSFLRELEVRGDEATDHKHVTPQLHVSAEPRNLRLEEECRAALSSSVQVASQTTRMAQLTAEELRMQSEQIHRVRRDAEATSHTLDTTDFLLKGMGSWWSSFTQIFRSPPKPPAPFTNEREEAPPTQPPARPPPVVSVAAPGTQFEQDMRRDMNQLSFLLDEMKSMAVETGYELRQQNRELDKVQTVMSTNEGKLERQREDLKKLSR